MNLKVWILLESVAFVAFAVTPIFLTRFVHFFEVETTLAVAVTSCFCLHALLGPAFLFYYLKIIPDKDDAKQMGNLLLVNIPLILLSIGLIGASLVAYLHSGNYFNDPYVGELAKLYNDTQGATNGYLDALHTKLSCCGVSRMELNLDSDPTSFRIPAYDVLTIFPMSCCPAPDDRCTYNQIFRDTCDSKHVTSIAVFNKVVTAFLLVSLISKITLAFVYQKHSDQLLTKSNSS